MSAHDNLELKTTELYAPKEKAQLIRHVNENLKVRYVISESSFLDGGCGLTMAEKKWKNLNVGQVSFCHFFFLVSRN